MVKIIFKNVGQGDSIIIEWSHQGKTKLGILDCNLQANLNPVLDHIIKNQITEIEFLILSHPHSDHFSGFYDLLNHCLTNQVTLNRFLYTAQSSVDYLKAATRGTDENNKLFDLFSLLNKMVEKEQISLHFVDDNPDLKIPLGEEFKMEFLAPSSIEINNYINGVNYPFNEESTGNPNANWLSTVCKIYNNKVSILLTSDVEAGVLSRIGKKNGGRLGKTKICLAQIPHHGSKGNLNKIFWQMRKRLPSTPLAISVGKNSYKHPSLDVLNFFQRQPNYVVYRTDSTNLISSSEKSQKKSALLDVFSSEILEDLSSGDKVFEVSGTEVELV